MRKAVLILSLVAFTLTSCGSKKKIAELEIEKQFDLSLSYTGSDWMTAFEKNISELIASDMAKLIQLLYRLDVDENTLRETLNDNPAVDAAKIVADMIMERQLQKIRTRKLYKKDISESDEFEKW